MGNKRKNIIILIVSLILLISVILIFIINKNNKNEKSNLFYAFEFIINNNAFKIKVSNGTVNVNRKYLCADDECDIKTENFERKYSNENYNKLVNFLQNNLKIRENENKKINLEELNPYTYNALMAIHQNEYIFETEYEKYKYKLIYFNDNYSKKYNFYFKDNNTIKVKILYYKENTIERIETSDISFSKENMDKLFNFAKAKTSYLEGFKYTKYGKLDKSDKYTFSALINNDEKYLNKNDIDLLYEIRYTDIKCPSPLLKLYSDNTYEYYSTYTTNGSDPTPKTGKFDYDVQSIVKNINNNKCTKNNVEIKNNENYIYQSCLSNKELNKFLNKYNFKLDVCIVKE